MTLKRGPVLVEVASLAGTMTFDLTCDLDAVDQCCSRSPHWPALLHAIAFLHLTVRQRCRLGAPAWNVPHDCALADLSSTVRCLQNHADCFARAEVRHWFMLAFAHAKITPAYRTHVFKITHLQYVYIRASLYFSSSSSSSSRSRRGPSRHCTTMSTVDSTPPEVSNRTCGIVS